MQTLLLPILQMGKLRRKRMELAHLHMAKNRTDVLKLGLLEKTISVRLFTANFIPNENTVLYDSINTTTVNQQRKWAKPAWLCII